MRKIKNLLVMTGWCVRRRWPWMAVVLFGMYGIMLSVQMNILEFFYWNIEVAEKEFWHVAEVMQLLFVTLLLYMVFEQFYHRDVREVVEAARFPETAMPVVIFAMIFLMTTPTVVWYMGIYPNTFSHMGRIWGMQVLAIGVYYVILRAGKRVLLVTLGLVAVVAAWGYYGRFF